MAGAVRQAGHEVNVFENLFAADPATELAARLKEWQPDVVWDFHPSGARRRTGDQVQGEKRYIDLRPHVKKGLVDTIRQNTPAFIVLGGPGFNYYARNWLDYLDVDYGIRGEGEDLSRCSCSS